MTCPPDQDNLPVTTCPPDQANLPVETCPEGPAAALARLSARLRSGEVTITLHPVLRTAALVAWAALSGACGAQGADRGPPALAFTRGGPRGEITSGGPLLDMAATERLHQAAEQASDHVGGRRRVEPTEMLQIVDVSPTFELARAELVDNDGATAHVRLVGAQQESYTLTLVFEDGAWHVRIPTPP